MNRWKLILKTNVILLIVLLLTACGEDPEIAQFRKSIDDFCTKISEIDSGINGIDAQSENAAAELLSYLDDLDIVDRKSVV